MGIKRQTEKSFMAAVIQFARLHRWTVYHTHDSRRSEDGFPDLVFRRGPEYAVRVVVAELKSERGETTTDQDKWLEALSTVAPTYLWKPTDWPMIERVLGAEAERQPLKLDRATDDASV